MFDIDFFRKTYGLKQEIVKKRLGQEEADRVFSEFEQERRATPHLFSIETTNNCNMTCVMCPRTTEMTRKVENMTPEIFERVAEQLQAHKGDSLVKWEDFVRRELDTDRSEKGENPFYFFTSSEAVTMHGFGEPLFDRQLAEKVRLLTAKGIPTYFSCNPSNIDLDRIEELFKAGLKYIKFSLDSLSDEKMKEIRGKQADYTQANEKVMQVLGIKERGNYPVTIVMCMINTGKAGNSDAEDFIATWKDKDVYAYIKSLDNQWYIDEGEREKARSHYEKQYCEFPWTSLSVMVDGTVVPCTQDFNCEMNMGNVMEASLEEIWNSEKYKEFRKMHITGNVPDSYRCKKRCDLKLVADYLSDK